MIGTIKYIADIVDLDTGYTPHDLVPGTFSEFVQWFHAQKMYQFDIETDITQWWPDRKLISMQFGSCTEDRVQWFLQWSQLTVVQQDIVKDLLRIEWKKKLIHNAAYEYIVMRFYGVILENISDTMLYEKILNGGIEIADNGLADISWKYLRIMMDKSLQDKFGDDILTVGHIVYGITDVAYLDSIRRQQFLMLEQEKLINVAGLEDEAVLAFSDITYEGCLISKEKWRDNIRLAQPLHDEDCINLNAFLFKAPFKEGAVKRGFLSDTDRVEINMRAPQQKADLLQKVFPDIAGAGLPVIKAYIRANGQKMAIDKLNILVSLQEKDTQPLLDYTLKYHRDWLIESGYLIPAGVVTINWNSWQQVLPIFQQAIPRLTGVSEDDLAKITHPIKKAYQNYKWTYSLITKMGEAWLEKYVSPDGKVRTNFNEIVSTGRVSSSNPNIQNITVDDRVGARYRNAFICEPGWSMVSSDYISQEVVIIAYMSQDPVWLEAIRKDQDLHSICAALLYGKKWKDATEEGCNYYKMQVNIDGILEEGHQRCSCKKHKTMRYDIKAINFGLAYGMSKFKLSNDMEISVPEAEALLTLYFKTFPAIARLLTFLGNFGLQNGHIITLAPFFRKRWFPYWRQFYDYIDVHIHEVRYIPQLGEIERASKNHPIQGSAADTVKVAMVLVRNYIKEHNLWDKVKLQMQIHDEIVTKATDEYAPYWKSILHDLMLQAGRVVIPSGILGADTTITPIWTK